MKGKKKDKKIQIMVTESDWLSLNRIQNKLEAENPSNRQSFSGFLRTILNNYIKNNQ